MANSDSIREFGKLPHERLAHWKEVLDDRLQCTLHSFRQGEVVTSSAEISKSPGARTLGFVVSGGMELFDTFVSAGIRAYRPIRLLAPGDVFNDFSCLDRLYGCDGVSRAGETWSLCAGRKSAIVTKSPIYPREFREKPSGAFAPHLALDASTFKYETIVAFIDEAAALKCSGFAEKLVAYSWPRAKFYRDSLNSFNFTQLLQFRRDAADCVADLEKNRKVTSKTVSKKQLLPLFVDAIWDACNRPLRGEPLFGHASDPETKALLDGIPHGWEVSGNLLTASDASTEGWFPLDCCNYLLSSYGNNEKSLEEAMRETFGRRTTGERTGSAFYHALAQQLVKTFKATHQPYDYEVSVEKQKTIDRDLLLLRFKNTAPKRSTTK